MQNTHCKTDIALCYSKHSLYLSSQASSDHWVVPAEDREQYEEIFELADSDFDAMVGGGEVKNIFMNSRLPQSVLAHIW